MATTPAAANEGIGPDWLDSYFFSQIPRSEFFAHFRGKHCYRTALDPKVAESLPSWSDFNHFLSYQRLSHPRIRMAQQGRSESRLGFLSPRQTRRGEAIYETQVDRILANLREGATLVMDAVDLSIPKVRALAASVAKHFLVRPQVNAYITFSDSRGFGLHWDDHDVLIVQLAGTKTWNMYGITREAPLHTDFHDSHRTPTEVEETILLKPGDIFYIPRGCWHDVLGTGEPTLHLTIGISSATGIDILSWLGEKAREQVELRRDVPLLPEIENPEFASAFKASLLHLLEGDFVDAFRRSAQQSCMPFPYVSLPYGVNSTFVPQPDVMLSLVPTSFHCLTEPMAFLVQSNCKTWTLPPVGSSLIALLGKKAITLQETWEACGQGYSLECWQEFINELIYSGLIHVPSEISTSSQ